MEGEILTYAITERIRKRGLLKGFKPSYYFIGKRFPEGGTWSDYHYASRIEPAYHTADWIQDYMSVIDEEELLEDGLQLKDIKPKRKRAITTFEALELLPKGWQLEKMPKPIGYTLFYTRFGVGSSGKTLRFAIQNMFAELMRKKLI